MKTKISILLCLVIICLCSCGNADNINETTCLSTQSPTNNNPQYLTNATKAFNVEGLTAEIKTDPDDLYSYTIKGIYDKIIYDHVKHQDSDFECETYYFIYDIDNNGTEELLIGRPRMVGYPAHGPYEYEIRIVEIYTIKDGAVVKQDIMYSWSEMCIYERTILDNGLLRYVGGAPDSLSYFYIKIADSKIVLFHELDNTGNKVEYGYLSPEKTSIFESDKTDHDLAKELYDKVEWKDLTLEEFDRLRAEIEGDAKPVEIKWKNIDEYGR